MQNAKKNENVTNCGEKCKNQGRLQKIENVAHKICMPEMARLSLAQKAKCMYFKAN